MLFEHLLEPGRPGRSSSSRPTTARCCCCERLGVELVPACRWRPTASTSAELEAALAAGPVKLAHVIPNFHNPAGCTLSRGEARAPGRARRRARLLDLRGRPLPRASVRGRAAADDALARRRPSGSIHASSFSKTVSPGVRVGYLAGPAEEIAKLAKRANETYISPNMLAEAIVLELCRSGGLDRNIDFVKGALAGAPRRPGGGARRADPRGGVRRPGRRLLPLARPRRGHRHDRSARRGARSEGVAFVAGPDFMIEGGDNSLRLSFASVPPEQVGRGRRRIARRSGPRAAPAPPPDARPTDPVAASPPYAERR